MRIGSVGADAKIGHDEMATRVLVMAVLALDHLDERMHVDQSHRSSSVECIGGCETARRWMTKSSRRPSILAAARSSSRR